jgi:hypothetical protein
VNVNLKKEFGCFIKDKESERGRGVLLGKPTTETSTRWYISFIKCGERSRDNTGVPR